MEKVPSKNLEKALWYCPKRTEKKYSNVFLAIKKENLNENVHRSFDKIFCQ